MAQSCQGTSGLAETKGVKPNAMIPRAAATNPPITELDFDDRELARLLDAFCEDPSDDGTFTRLEILLRGRGRWEIIPDHPTKRAPPLRKQV